MASANPCAVVAVKVFVEEHEVSPVVIGLELGSPAIDGSPTVGTAKKFGTSRGGSFRPL
jgi:hypothetical protein